MQMKEGRPRARAGPPLAPVVAAGTSPPPVQEAPPGRVRVWRVAQHTGSGAPVSIHICAWFPVALNRKTSARMEAKRRKVGPGNRPEAAGRGLCHPDHVAL